METRRDSHSREPPSRMETNPRPTKVLIVKLMDKVMHGRANGVERSKDTHRRALFNSIFMTSKIEVPWDYVFLKGCSTYPSVLVVS
jgi:hypothetical protein